MIYFLKRCGFQELGSVGTDGKPKRGRYLLISKNKKILELFPSLDKHILNDCAVLPIIPLYSRDKVYCNYVYHNSKYNAVTSKNNRDEYRIYLNRELENQQLYFTTLDIMVMRSFKDSATGQTCYYLYLVRDHSSKEYLQVSRIIDESNVNGNYGLFDGELDFFEQAVNELDSTGVNSHVKIDDTVTERIAQSSQQVQNNVFNAATFRDFVMTGYGNACAISGKRFEENSNEIDVVYIKPRSNGGSCLPDNGIALSSDLSMPFLKGMFTIGEQYEIKVHPQIKNSDLCCFEGRQIRVPPHVFFRPSQENLKYHRDHIWGSFLWEENDF